jgi:hypothetical protein
LFDLLRALRTNLLLLLYSIRLRVNSDALKKLNEELMLVLMIDED